MNDNPTSLRNLAALGVAATLVLVACGGGDDETGDTTPAAAEQSTPESATGGGDEGASSAATITIADFAFDGVTEVAVGTTVVVTNDDGAAHTWTAADDTFDSGTLEPGSTFEFTFTEAGEFSYSCNFHPSMTGTIVVTG